MSMKKYYTTYLRIWQAFYLHTINIFVGLSNICHTFLEISIVEIPNMIC